MLLQSPCIRAAAHFASTRRRHVDGLWATRIIGIKVDAPGATTFALARGAVAGGSEIDLATAALAGSSAYSWVIMPPCSSLRHFERQRLLAHADSLFRFNHRLFPGARL